MHKPQIAIIDTCVLFDALIINYLRTEITNAKDPRKTELEQIVFGSNKIYKLNYTELLAGISKFVTTSQVIGELQGLVNSKLKLKHPKKTVFWKNSLEFLKIKVLDEKLIELIKLSSNGDYDKFLYEIGYVDTGLIELAKQTKLPIITNDYKTLYQIAEKSGVDCIVPRNSIH